MHNLEVWRTTPFIVCFHPLYQSTLFSGKMWTPTLLQFLKISNPHPLKCVDCPLWCSLISWHFNLQGIAPYVPHRALPLDPAMQAHGSLATWWEKMGNLACSLPGNLHFWREIWHSEGNLHARIAGNLKVLAGKFTFFETLLGHSLVEGGGYGGGFSHYVGIRVCATV